MGLLCKLQNDIKQCYILFMHTNVCSKIVNGGIPTNLVIISGENGRGEGLEREKRVLLTLSAIFFLKQ